MRIAAGALLLAASAAHALDPKQCAFADCQAGDVVVTTPSATSTPSCARQGVTLYVAFVARPMLPPGEDRERLETELRLRAGARSLDDAMKMCHITPAGQRAKVTAMGVDKSGLLQVAPLDGSPPYWISNFDVSRP